MTIFSASAFPESYSSSKIIKQDNDVLCGRGGLSNNHPGNHVYRRIVNANREFYQTCQKPSYKHCVVVSIIIAIKRNGGRFIEQKKGGGWQEISSKKAVLKTSQALRESQQDSKSIKIVKSPRGNRKQKLSSSTKVETTNNAKNLSFGPPTLDTSKPPNEIVPPPFARLVSDDMVSSNRLVNASRAPNFNQGTIRAISSQERHHWVHFM